MFCKDNANRTQYKIKGARLLYCIAKMQPKEGFLGNYFLVEDVKKKGTSFIVIGTGHGVKSQTEMTASEIIWLSRHRELETTFKYNDKECYKKYVLC